MEEIFHEQLKGFLLSPTELIHYFESADKTIKEKEELLNNLENESVRLKQEMDKLVRLHLNDEIPSAGFKNHYNPFFDRNIQIENTIPELQAEIDFLKIQFLSSDEILHEAKNLYERWQSFIPDEKRKIIETLTDKIIVDKNEISFQLQYIPSQGKLTTDGHRNFTDSLRRQA